MAAPTKDSLSDVTNRVDYDDEPPPPYTSVADTGETFVDTGPSASAANADLPTSSANISADRILPLAFNIYYKESWKRYTLHLGEHAATPLHAATQHWTPMPSNKPGVTLHASADVESPMLATATRERVMSYKTLITVPPLPGSPRGAIAERLHPVNMWTSGTYWFAVGVGDDLSPERFEWRYSQASEVRELDKNSWGFKLVRVGQQAPEGRGGGKRKEREVGEAGDGKEVVAVWAGNSKWSKDKLGKFQFLGSGATGELGKEWELMAVVTFLVVWQIYQGY